MKKIRLLFIFILLSKGMLAFCQFDTEFWFAVPYIDRRHDANNEYRLVFATSNHASTVTISDIVIYDMLGRIQNIGKSENRTSDIGKSEINVSHLPSGVYFLRVGQETVKFVKQ